MKPLLLALLLAVAPAAAFAGEVTDLIMAPGVMRGDGPLVYDHRRHLAPAGQSAAIPGMIPPREIAEGRLRLAPLDAAEGPRLALSRSENGTALPVADFPVSGPNPVLLFFLENVVRSVAAQTGGSPFYIRNRIREALAAAPVGDGAGPRTTVLRPFEADPNRARLGDFAGLAIAITFDPDAPGRLIELKADTGAGAAGYSEAMTLVAEE